MSETTKQRDRAIVTTPGDRDIRIERVFDATRPRVWRAMTEPEQVKRWWGRGNELEIVRMEVERGGHWRFVEHADGGAHGFEGRYGDIVPEESVVLTFEWDGMPTHVTRETMRLEDVPGGRTKLVTIAQFFTPEDRDGMLHSGMESGMNESYAALDRLLEGES